MSSRFACLYSLAQYKRDSSMLRLRGGGVYPSMWKVRVGTLTCQIIVYDHLIVQVADFSEINKCVGPNKALYEGFFLIYIGENQVLKGKSLKLINVQVLIRFSRCFSPQKLIKFDAQLFGRSEYTTLLGPTRLSISEIFPSKPDLHLYK